MRPQFNQVCQSCAASEQRTSAKEGTRKAYFIGAIVCLAAVVIVILRVMARMR